MSLCEYEKETVIQFDESTNLATIYTASYNVSRTLRKAGYKPQKKAGAWWFEVPIMAVKIDNVDICTIQDEERQMA